MRKKVIIPKSFVIFAHDYQVIMSSDLYDRTGWDNCSYYNRNRIEIYCTNRKGERACDESVIESFFQRLSHVLFFEIGVQDKTNLFNLFGKALYQFFKTADYDPTIDDVIPSKFSIFAREYEVEFVDTFYRDSGNTGLIFFAPGKIKVEIGSEQHLRDIWRVRKSFFHELIHAIFDEIEYDDLNDDEDFVDLLAQALTQTVKTFKYSKGRK